MSAWKLQALLDIEALGIRRDEVWDVPEIEAAKLIASDLASIVEQPKEPPAELLTHLREKMADLDPIGPMTLGAKPQSRIDKRVFANGIRKTFVDAAHLHWSRGKTGLRKMIGQCLSGTHEPPIDLFRSLRIATIETIPPHRLSAKALEAKIYGAEYARRMPDGVDTMAVDLLAPLSTSNSEQTVYEVLVFQAEFEDVLARAIQQGRVVVGQEAKAGDRYIAPQSAAGKPIADFDDSYYFLASRDLPRSIVEDNVPLDTRRKQAARWAKAAYEHFLGQGKIPTVDTMTRAMCGKYGLTTHAAEEAWKLADIRGIRSGNYKADQKVELDEVLAFRNR